MLNNIFQPYHTMQEINLDWILTKVKNILRFVPDDGAVGQILRRTAHGAEWSDEQGAGGSVTSVNGMQGAVVLTYSDVGALPDTYSAPVDSVNGQTGTVVLGKSDIGLGNVDNVQQYSATNPPPYPVTSVNSQTGAVVLSIPSDTSDLTNTAGFVDSAGAAAAAPVQSVNGQTGAVSLTIPTFHTLRYQFTNLAQYTDYVYYISMPNAMDTAQIPANATVFGMLVDGWSGLGQTFNVCRNGLRGIYVLHQPNFTITSSSYITVYFYYYT